jgi:hypothetical protein
MKRSDEHTNDLHRSLGKKSLNYVRIIGARAKGDQEAEKRLALYPEERNVRARHGIINNDQNHDHEDRGQKSK